jgi:protein farnesyltransferase subunit beta
MHYISLQVTFKIQFLHNWHFKVNLQGLQNLSAGFISLDCSRPWICYWICHALYLLHKEPVYLFPRIISTLLKMQNSSGGFGGGPHQLSHGAPNYAAVLTLLTISSPEAMGSIDRVAMYRFFLSLKNKNSGGFAMHIDGALNLIS